MAIWPIRLKHIRNALGRKSRWHLYEQATKSLVTYVRLSATVIVATVMRVCLDSVGIIYTGQDPASVSFWYGHCSGATEDGHCLLVAFVLFLAALTLGSWFGWCCQDWIADPARNPYATRYSFAILIDASQWLPISVIIGKTNALVEFALDITEDDVVQGFMSSAIAAFLTLSGALFTHYSMKFVTGVWGHNKVKEAGLIGFCKYSLLVWLFCLQWAVAWSNWVMITSLIDALEPGKTVHSTAVCIIVISLCFLTSACFYLRFGPEPVIPDAETQQICYKHGYANTVWRSLRSYLVYSSLVFIIMCATDARYGGLRVVAFLLNFNVASLFDVKALFDLGAIALGGTVVAALISAAITRLTSVDMETSMKLSRSAYEARSRLCEQTRSEAELLGYEQMMKDASELLDPEEPFKPKCEYSAMETEPTFSQAESDASDDFAKVDVAVGAYFSRAIGASVLFYDTIAFVVCIVWGRLAIQLFGTLLGNVAELHWLLYMLCCLLYAVGMTVAMARFCWVVVPSTAEKRLQEEQARTARQLQVAEPPESFSEPFLEEQEAVQAPSSDVEMTPKGDSAYHAPCSNDVSLHEATSPTSTEGEDCDNRGEFSYSCEDAVLDQ